MHGVGLFAHAQTDSLDIHRKSVYTTPSSRTTTTTTTTSTSGRGGTPSSLWAHQSDEDAKWNEPAQHFAGDPADAAVRAHHVRVRRLPHRMMRQDLPLQPWAQESPIVLSSDDAGKDAAADEEKPQVKKERTKKRTGGRGKVSGKRRRKKRKRSSGDESAADAKPVSKKRRGVKRERERGSARTVRRRASRAARPRRPAPRHRPCSSARRR